MTREQVVALREIARSILDTVKECGETGAPGGILYAGLMTAGCTFNQFNSIMGGLVNAGYLRLDTDVYYYVKGL